MSLFAAGIGGFVEFIVFLVVIGIAAINRMLAARKDTQPVRRMEQRPEQPARAGVNPMEPQDVDQFLDEVLGRGAAAGKRVPPQKNPPVVILRPTNPPPVPQGRPRPEVRRPVTRAVVPRPARPARPGQVPVAQQQPKVRSEFSESVQKDVDKAAAATQQSVTLDKIPVQQVETTRRDAALSDVVAMLRSPADIRRAILVREILGPPVALRRRKL